MLQCLCQQGYVGRVCDQKQRPCADNPCESRGECFEKNGKFHCRYVNVAFFLINRYLK